MSPANLQIEGLLLAMAALNRALVDKGLLSLEEAPNGVILESQAAGRRSHPNSRAVPERSKARYSFAGTISTTCLFSAGIG